MLTHYGLFSGIGGFELAAKWAGFETIGMCERDEYCRQVLKRHFPGVMIKEDVNDIDGSETGGAPVTLITAGVPCQAASIAGKRRGKNDDRWLWPAALRAVSALRPTWAVFENPLGIDSLDEFGGLSDLDGEAFEAVPESYASALDEIIGQIEALGYEVQPVALPAAAVAAPHQRMRIFIVAHAGLLTKGIEEQRPDCEQLNSPAARIGSIKRHRLGNRCKSVADTTGAETRRRPRKAGAGEPDPGQRSGDGGQALPDANCDRITSRLSGSDTRQKRKAGVSNYHCSKTLTDADGPGLEEQRGAESAQQKHPSFECSLRSVESGVGRMVDGLSAGLDRGFEWEPEPDIPRVAAGIPNREPRLRALGNALVPQQIHPILAAIAAVEAARC